MINGTGPYQTGINDLQVLLSDQSDDRMTYLHRCFGQIDGSNAQFKTFYRRRATNFTTATGSVVGVYVTGPSGNVSLIPASGVSSDDTESGVFVLGTAPAAGSIVEATYFYQWFDQSELDTFLQVAGGWLQGSNDYTQTPYPLVTSLLKYAAAEGYLKMAQRWRSYMSQEYKVEDAPKDSPTYTTKDFLDMSEAMREEALASRTEFYQTRQGRALQPLFGSIRGRIRTMP